MKKLIACAALAAVASGCISVHQNDGGNECRTPLMAKDIVHEKYEVGQKPVTAQDEISCLFNVICWGSSAKHVADVVPFGFGGIAKAKNGAYANACDAAKCDQVVGSKYKITVEDYFVFKKIKAEISGYPSSLTGVEVIENKVPCNK